MATIEDAARYFGEGAIAEAETVCRDLLALQPRHFDALYLLAVIAHGTGRYEEAVSLLEQATERDPRSVHALNNLGLAYRSVGRLDRALSSFQRVLSLDANFVEAHVNAALVQLALGENDTAAAALRQALTRWPATAEAHLAMAQVLQAQNRPAEAIVEYREALALNPRLVDAHMGLGSLLQAQDLMDEAISCFEAALKIRPDFAEARWLLAMSKLAMVYEDGDSSTKSRASFSEALASLDAWFTGDHEKLGVNAVGVYQPFFLAYQEVNNRALLSQYGDLCCRLMGTWQKTQGVAPTASASGRVIRVGVVSGHLYEHSVFTALVRGWCTHIDRSRFSLHLFYTGATRDGETLYAESRADSFVQNAGDLREWVDAIVEKRIDVLIFPEVGMVPMTTKLACLRLAPTQVAAWGHPETTGLPTIDYYLSADDFEPPDAQANYREKIVALPHLGCTYGRQNVSGVVPDLDMLGVAHDAPLLLCPGTPFKYAPRNDWIFVEIARRLDRCQLVFFTHVNKNPSDKFRARLKATFEQERMSFEEHCVFIPWQTKPGFFGLLRRADVFLDTIGFSGFNTAMQAIECGLPVVALEGKFMRGRLASGILKRLRLPELVAHTAGEYVDIAVALIEDDVHRQRMRNRIEASRDALFGDIAPVRALEAFVADTAHGRRGHAAGR